MVLKLKIKLIHLIRIQIWIIITGLTLSGLTAFPIETELNILVNATDGYTGGLLHNWLFTVYHAVKYVNQNHPYLSYGTDWLAFAHLMLALLFTGVLKDPVRNIWVVEFGIIAAVAIFPLAFIAGDIREIPVFWRLIDCSFGVTTLIILMPCYRMLKIVIRLNYLTNDPISTKKWDHPKP